MNLIVRIILALALVNSVAVGIGVVILLARYETVVSGLQVSRVTVTAAALKATIESQLALGLPLSDAQDIAEVVARAAVRDPDLDAILVYEPDGRIVFASRETLRGGAAPPPAVALLNGRTGNRQASWRDDPFGIVAAPLVNGFGIPAGGLLLRFSRAAPVRALEGATEQLLAHAIVVLLASVVVLGATAYVAFRPLTRLAQEAARSMEAMTHDDSVAGLPSGGWLAHELHAFEQDARQALSDVKQAEHNQEKLPQ